MTVAEARKLLAKLPDDAPLCYASELGIVEVSRFDLVRAVGNPGGYIVAEAGDIRIAVAE